MKVSEKFNQSKALVCVCVCVCVAFFLILASQFEAATVKVSSPNPFFGCVVDANLRQQP